MTNEHLKAGDIMPSSSVSDQYLVYSNVCESVPADTGDQQADIQNLDDTFRRHGIITELVRLSK